MIRRKGWTALSAAVAASVATRVSSAAVHSWIGTTSGNWSSSANWVAGNVPVSGTDTAVFFLVPAGSITFNANNDIASPFTLNVLFVQNSSTQPQTISGGQLRFNKSGSQQETLSFQVPSGTASFGAATINNDIITTQDLAVVTGRFPATLTGQISGAGKITGTFGGTFNFTGANSYTGGTILRSTTIHASGAGNMGTGSLQIGTDELLLNQLGIGWFDSAANVTSGPASIHVGQNSYVQFGQLDQAALTTIDSRSKGYIVLDNTATVSSIDLSNYPRMRIGTDVSSVNRGTVTLGSTIIPGNNQYRFGGHDIGTTDINNADTLLVASQLSDGSLGQVRSVSIGAELTGRGGKVVLNNFSNNYSGGTTVERGALFTDMNASLVFDYTPAPGQTPLGTGSVNVRGGALIFEGTFGAVGSLPNYINMEPGGKLVFNNAIGSGTTAVANNLDRWGDSKPLDLDGTEFTLRTAGTHSETIGDVSYTDGNHIRIERTGNIGTTTLIVNSFNRVGRGTIQLSPITSNQFGTTHRVQVLNSGNIVDATTGMVHPSIVAQRTGDGLSNSGEFLQVVSNNLTPYTYATSPNTGTDTEVVSIGFGGFGFVWGFPNETVWALRCGAASVNFGSGTLSIRSGGLIMAGTLNTANGTVHFNNNGTDVEGLIYVNDGTPSFAGTLNSSVTTSAGITKFGEGDLWLNGNNFFTGGLNVNQGLVRLNNAGALNAASPNAVQIGPEAAFDLGGFSLTLPSLTGTGQIQSTFTGTTTLTLNTTGDQRFDGRIVGTTTRIFALTKTGPGMLTLGGFGRYHGMTTVAAGTLNLAGANLGVLLNSGGVLSYLYGDYTTSPGAALRVSTDHRVNNVLGGGSTYIGGDAELIAASIRQNLLDIAPGGRTTILANGGTTGTSRVASLNINNGTIDLNDNDLVIDYQSEASPINTIKSHIAAGRIKSSLATPQHSLGYADNAALNLSTFSGQSVDPTTVLVKYTYFGDADLDGDADGVDIGTWATNFTGELGGGASATRVWSQGDWDYDGDVDGVDAGFWATAFTGELGGSGLASVLVDSPIDPGAGSILDGMGITVVPEPATAAPLGLCLAGLSSRRRMRSR